VQGRINNNPQIEYDNEYEQFLNDVKKSSKKRLFNSNKKVESSKKPIAPNFRVHPLHKSGTYNKNGDIIEDNATMRL
jgi:hypothetical protein